MLDLNTTLRSLTDLVSDIVSVNALSYPQRTSSYLGGLISANIAISILEFGDLAHADHPSSPGESRQNSKIYPFLESPEPLIDVIESEHEIKVIVCFVGVKKENVSVDVTKGAIEMEIRTHGQIHQKIIPCNVEPDSVLVTSTLNNSVMELVFKKI